MENTDKLLFKKEILLSVIGWSVLCYLISLILFVIGFVIATQKPILGLFLMLIIPAVFLFVILFLALKRNYQRFSFFTYEAKLGYVTYIFLAYIIITWITETIITRHLSFPNIGLIGILAIWVVPLLVKNRANNSYN